MNKKQRLREFIASRPRGAIARLAEYIGVSPVSVHSWLDDEKGWMTRNNAKKVEEFIKQEQEADQPLPAQKEVIPLQIPPQTIENFTRDVLEVLQRYAPHIQLPGVVKEKQDRVQRAVSTRARPQGAPHSRRGKDRRVTDRRTVPQDESKNNPFS